jgi:predicted nucleic acid-binding protein
MAVLLDSSVLIEAERRHYPLSRIVALADGSEPMALPALAVSEMLLGVYLSRPSAQRTYREDFIERMVERFDVLAFELPVARLYARLWADLRRAGNLIAPHDLMIGATALVHGYDILTHDIRDFDRIPGLKVRLPGW